MAGGARKGAGRPAKRHKKKAYSTKLRPDQILWLRSKKRGWAAQFFEQVIDEAIEAETTKQRRTIMGWGNGQVEYGAAPIYGGGVVYEDTRAIEFLQKENQKLIGYFEKMFISNRAWIIVAHTLANSKNREHRSKDELNAMHKQAKSILFEYVKKHGFKEFNRNPPPLVSLEP